MSELSSDVILNFYLSKIGIYIINLWLPTTYLQSTSLAQIPISASQTLLFHKVLVLVLFSTYMQFPEWPESYIVRQSKPIFQRLNLYPQPRTPLSASHSFKCWQGLFNCKKVLQFSRPKTELTVFCSKTSLLFPHAYHKPSSNKNTYFANFSSSDPLRGTLSCLLFHTPL